MSAKNSDFWKVHNRRKKTRAEERQQEERRKELRSLEAQIEELERQKEAIGRRIRYHRSLTGQQQALLRISAYVSTFSLVISPAGIVRWARTPASVQMVIVGLCLLTYLLEILRVVSIRRYLRTAREPDWDHVFRSEKIGIFLCAVSVAIAFTIFFHVTNIGVLTVSLVTRYVPVLATEFQPVLVKLVEITLGGIIGNAAYDHLKKRLAAASRAREEGT